MRQSRHLGMNGMRQYYKEFDYIPQNEIGRIADISLDGEWWHPNSKTWGDNEAHAGFGYDWEITTDENGNQIRRKIDGTDHGEAAVFRLQWDAMKKNRGNAIGFKIYVGGWGWSSNTIALRWCISSIDPSSTLARDKFGWSPNALSENECYLQGQFSIPVTGSSGNSWYTFGCWPDATTKKLNLVDNYWTKNKNKFFTTNQQHIYLYLWTARWQQNNIHIIDKNNVAAKLCIGYMGYSRIKD